MGYSWSRTFSHNHHRTFVDIRNWIRNIEQHASDNVNKILVGNKADMDESKRAVPTSRGQALADEYGIKFFETSAKTNLNVEPVFFSIARDIQDSMFRMLLLCGLAILSWIDQDDARHTFGHTGGFTCPFVPFIPIACIIVNVYLLINLGTGTWIRVSLWLLIGTFVYVFYGRTHSALHDAVYVSTAHAEEIYQTSSEHLA